jgi:hypothetical protein
MLTGFSSSRADGKSSNFWTEELGFTNTMLVTPTSKRRENNDYYRLGRAFSGWGGVVSNQPQKLPNVYYVPNFNFSTLEMGRQRTAPYLTAAVSLPEGRKLANYVLSTTANAGYGDPKVSGSGAPNGYLGIATTDTTSVFGTRSLQSILASDAFYKVVINGVPAARIHTSESVQFISAIVGKYRRKILFRAKLYERLRI